MKKTQDANVVGKIHHTIKNEFVRERQRIAKQFPLGFTLAVAFGVSLVFSGVNGIIQHVSFLKNNPIYMLLAGTIILLATGTLYKKIG